MDGVHSGSDQRHPSVRGNIFFASDFHLGIPDHRTSLEREKKIVAWLRREAPNMAELWLLGDVFDFWMDYKSVVPRGFVRLLGQLAELTDSGIPVHYFPGNHDQWLRDYFSKELGVVVHQRPLCVILGSKKFFLAHGDGLGPGDYGYKMIQWLFSRPFNRWLFRQVHPDLGARLARFFSYSSRHYSFFEEPDTVRPEKERLFLFCQKYQTENTPVDFFVFGHRHKPLWLPLPSGGVYVNLGDWLHHNSYGRFDGQQFLLEKYSE
ncbi:MAG: UDP-2,3-diacylglucosamine diphosphatase [Flavobacteriales bacterium]|nr:UDP-2,3-diacylglucosamine diphosphatase [Flavobacteriales bacterium]